MANYLQFGPPKRMCQAYRGAGKSWLTAAFVVWALYHKPQRKILIVSASKDFADTNSYMIKRIIDELPECHFLKPDPAKGQRDSMVAFDVGPALPDKSPSVKSVGIFGQTTGSRADIIIADDIEVPKNSTTPMMRQNLSERCRDLNDVLKPDIIDGKPVPEDERPSIIYLGTPQSEMSYYNDLPSRGYDIRIWPARVPTDVSLYRERLAPFVLDLIAKGARAGDPVDPKRFDNRVLLTKEMEAGKSRFALQYQLDTSLSDALKYPLRLEDLIITDVDSERGPAHLAYGKDVKTRRDDLQPVGFTGDLYYGPFHVSDDWAEFQGCVMAIDPSGRGLDETAYAVVKMLHGKLFLVASGGFKGGYTPENLEALAKVAKEHKANSIVIEKNFGDGMFGALLKPVLTRVYPCTIEEATATGQKETRIIGTLEPVFNQHRLVVDAKVVKADLETAENAQEYSLFYQLTRITKERGCLSHDDRLDALEMAVKYWQSQMETDEESAADKHREDEMQQMLDDWLDRMNNQMLGHNGGPALGDEDWDARSGNSNYVEDF